MIDQFAKVYLHDALQWGRTSLLGKLDGLSEYNVRRPLSRTRTGADPGVVPQLVVARPTSDDVPAAQAVDDVAA